jgi:hypothetical protein
MNPYQQYSQLGPLPTGSGQLQPSFTRPAGSVQPAQDRIEPFDGLSRVSRLRRLPYRWINYVIPSLRELRNDPNLRMRIYASPTDTSTVIGANLHYTEQVMMTPGSWVWGVQFAKITAASANSDFSVACRETNGDALWSNFVTCAGFVPNGTSGIRPWLLPVPWLCKSGFVTVEIVNKNSTTDGRCQFCLMVLEPNLLPDARRTGIDTLTPMASF